MSVEAILARLQGVRRNRDGWMALCPAHADHNPSLSIRELDRRILLYCFAGCRTEAICNALKIEMHDLFAEPRAAVRTEPPIVRQAKKQVASLCSSLTRRDRERAVTAVLADDANIDAAIARALALAVEGELVQVVFKQEHDV